MCYFNNKNANDVTEREALQQQAIEENFNLDFYSRLKQVNLLSESCKNDENFIDIESIIRKNLIAFLVLLNSSVFLKTKISQSEYLYKLNEFLFEITLCENICNFIKNSKNKIIHFKAYFLKEKVVMQIKYKGKKILPRSYLNNIITRYKKGMFYNVVNITINCASIKKEQPPKINLDGCLKNRLSAIYIALCLSGLKRFN